VFAEFIAPPPVTRTESKWSRVRETAIAEVRHRAGLLFGEDALQRALSLHAVETAEALLRHDPLDGPAVELLVRGLIATGDAPEACRRYRSYAAALAAEHDAEPAFRLESLFTRSDRRVACAQQVRLRVRSLQEHTCHPGERTECLLSNPARSA